VLAKEFIGYYYKIYSTVLNPLTCALASLRTLRTKAQCSPTWLLITGKTYLTSEVKLTCSCLFAITATMIYFKKQSNKVLICLKCEHYWTQKFIIRCRYKKPTIVKYYDSNLLETAKCHQNYICFCFRQCSLLSFCLYVI